MTEPGSITLLLTTVLLPPPNAVFCLINPNTSQPQIWTWLAPHSSIEKDLLALQRGQNRGLWLALVARGVV